MKKTWVKRENIFYKPFYKQKSKMLLLFIFILGILFIVYQAFSINELINDTHGGRDKTHSSTPEEEIAEDEAEIPGKKEKSESGSNENNIKIIRGIRLFDYDAYKPNYLGKFKCLDGNKEIQFERVNDDYCDCLTDGSDEPSTNACSNGKFYCKYQKRHLTGRGTNVFVPSSRVNDGICDCCDGSDEWLTKTTCPNMCR